MVVQQLLASAKPSKCLNCLLAESQAEKVEELVEDLVATLLIGLACTQRLQMQAYFCHSLGHKG